jgi:hypothetical protein
MFHLGTARCYKVRCYTGLSIARVSHLALVCATPSKKEVVVVVVAVESLPVHSPDGDEASRHTTAEDADTREHSSASEWQQIGKAGRWH